MNRPNTLTKSPPPPLGEATVLSDGLLVCRVHSYHAIAIYTYTYIHSFGSLFVTAYVHSELTGYPDPIRVCFYRRSYSPFRRPLGPPSKLIRCHARARVNLSFICDECTPRTPPPPLTQHTAATRPAAPTPECTGPASTGPRMYRYRRKW